MNTILTSARLALAVLIAAITFTMTTASYAEKEVNVYSYRQPFLLEPLTKAFEAKTGIKVNVRFAKKGLIELVKAEGKLSKADVVLTVDIGRLTKAVNEGISQPVKSDELEKNIPSAFRDPKGHWFGLTTRARIVYASKERVKQDAITLEELADPKWKGKICIRNGQHVYNVAMIASMIANNGEEKAKAWLTGLKANLARKPSGNDRAQVKGIYSGECDLAIGNMYYMGKMQNNKKQPEQQKWAASVKLLFPNTKDRGTHVNVSGVVLAKFAPNKANAIKFMEFLSSDEAQKIYAKANSEYPVKPGVEWSELVKSWGTFKADPIALESIAKNRKRASELVDEVAFNNGPSS